MKRPGRRAVFWPLLALSAATAACWLFHVPYRPGRLWRAVPADAQLVSRHRALSARWDTLAHHPVPRFALERVLGEGAADRLAADRPFRRWLERFARRDTLFARWQVPQSAGRTAWMASCWVGGRGPLIRLLLARGRIPGTARFGRHNGRSLWTLDVPDLPDGTVVSFAIEEGVLLVCASASPRDLRDLLDTFDGVAPSRRPGAADAARDAADDVLWLSLPWRGEMVHARAELVWLTPADTLLRVDGLPAAAVPDAAPSGLDGLARLLGPTPEAAAWFRVEALTQLLPWERWPPALEHFGLLAQHRPERALVVALAGGEDGGRFRGLRVPAVFAAYPVDDPAKAAAVLSGALDGFNAVYRWGLIGGTRPVAGGEMRVLEATGDVPYANRPPAEQIAYTIRDGWVVFASNAPGLERVLSREGGAEPVPWRNLPCAGGARASAWIDGERFAPTLQLALSVYSLHLLLERGESAAPERARLDRLAEWAEALRAFRSIRVAWERRGEGTRLRLLMRAAPHPLTPETTP